MELAYALAIAREHRSGVLVTHRRDGRAQLSNIAYALGDDNVFRVSITADRVKTKNLARDPRCELYVGRPDFGGYLVFDAACDLMPVTTDPNDVTADALVEYYRMLRGDHPDWAEYRQVMVNDHRLVARLAAERAYGMWPS
ncbi:MAG: PPOX class F420-dependent oxidoreductase [Actinobacteria bacterium]|nr:PPOX class F420-dependent oxidoreductase [Actinomycetota bacterium]